MSIEYLSALSRKRGTENLFATISNNASPRISPARSWVLVIRLPTTSLFFVTCASSCVSAPAWGKSESAVWRRTKNHWERSNTSLGCWRSRSMGGSGWLCAGAAFLGACLPRALCLVSHRQGSVLSSSASAATTPDTRAVRLVHYKSPSQCSD